MAIYHVTTRAEWEAAEDAGVYLRSTKGASLDEVGFIHASTREQLPATAAFLYADSAEPLVVLELDDDGIRRDGVSIPYEDGGAGESFPHVYGPIRMPYVTSVSPARFEDGRFVVLS
jgi:uncharacterized protein (DUF952 family)